MAVAAETREQRRRRKQAEAAQKRKEADPEGYAAKRSAAYKKYRETHPEKVRAEQKSRNQKNPARQIENNRRFRTENPDYASRWFQENADRLKKVRAEWRSRNPDRLRFYRHLRQARKRGGEGNYSLEDIEDIRRLQSNKCACCGVGLGGGYEIDHILPLAKGGSNARRNIQLLCRSCNRRKSSRDPIDFMRSVGRLL